MRFIWKWAVMLAFLAVGVALAKEPEHLVPEGTTIQLLLLRQKSVRQELKITPKEREKIFEFTHKQHEAAQQAMKLGAGERKEKFAKLHKANEQFLENALTPEQRKRLDQITLQVAGLHWLTRPAIARELKLTRDQEQKARELHKESRKEVVEIIHAKSSTGRHEKLAELRKATRQKLMNLLTPDQKARWKELAGPPFTGQLVFEEPEAGSKK